MFSSSITALLLTTLLLGRTHAYPQNPPPSDYPLSTIQWGPCPADLTELEQPGAPIDCGNITVPRDYTDIEGGGTIEIELVRSRAIALTEGKEARGSVLMNFGGPGGSGREEIAGLALKLQVWTGGEHDLISFDQRGVGKTLLFECFKDDFQTAMQMSRFAETGNASEVSVGRLFGIAGSIAYNCEENAKEVGEVIGSAFTARDLMQIVDALGGDRLLRYWGLSYGTALGHTVTSMFPDRVARVVLDANLNPHEWWKGHDVQMYADTDKTFNRFTEGCVETPEMCELATEGATPESIQKTIYDLLDVLKYEPVVYKDTVVEWSWLRGNILGLLYTPSLYPVLATVLHGLATGNTSALAAFPQALLETEGTGDRRWGIVCSDKTSRGREEGQVAVDDVMAISKIAGDTAVPFVTICSQWKFDAKERWEGPYEIQTSHPVLLIQNTYDPVTPMVSARNLSAVFEGSVLLEQKGSGHSSLAQPSLCTTKALRDYLNDGTLPEQGATCEVDVPLFTELTWADVLVPKEE